jgi:hypothetical protein
MRYLIILFLFIFTGCGSIYYGKTSVVYSEKGLEATENIGFWDQKVIVTAWGFTMITAYGPFNIGYLQWQRNIEQPKDPAEPSPFLHIK